MSDTITLYSFPQRITLIYASGYSRTRNMPYNSTRKIVYKGVDNTIGFEIKNQDRKPINLLSREVWVNLMVVRGNELVFQRRANITDPANGICELTIPAPDLNDLHPGIYQMSASVSNDIDGSITESLYADNNRRATIEIEIADGAYPTFRPSHEATFTSSDGLVWESQPMPGNLAYREASTLHTIQVATHGFKGKFWAAVSMEYNQFSNYTPVIFQDGGYLVLFDGTALQDNQGWNFLGTFRWLKIFYQADEDNTGTVDKVLYRS